jgi:hypothetical protein
MKNKKNMIVKTFSRKILKILFAQFYYPMDSLRWFLVVSEKNTFGQYMFKEVNGVILKTNYNSFCPKITFLSKQIFELNLFQLVIKNA